MKKAVLFSLLFLLVQQYANAQITNTVWGLTTCKSSKQDVERVLRDKGYYYSEETKEDRTISISIDCKRNKCSFASEEWTDVSFYIYENTLYYITFWNFRCKNGYAVLDRLEDKLDKKYNDPTFVKEEKRESDYSKPKVKYWGDTYIIEKGIGYDGHPDYSYKERKTSNEISLSCSYNDVCLSFYNGSWLHHISKDGQSEL